MHFEIILSHFVAVWEEFWHKIIISNALLKCLARPDDNTKLIPARMQIKKTIHGFTTVFLIAAQRDGWRA